MKILTRIRVIDPNGKFSEFFTPQFWPKSPKSPAQGSRAKLMWHE
jgi:hypothetical protein